VSPETGDFVPLDETVAIWLETHSRGALEIVGGPGAGKTTALAHLAYGLLPNAHTLLIDDAKIVEVTKQATLRRVIYTSCTTYPHVANVSLRLTSWGDDELIEYVLAVHADRCRSVMTRVRAAADRRMLHGVPELWRIVLDGMACDESAVDWRTVLWNEIEPLLVDDQNRRLACDHCLAVLCGALGDSEYDAANLHLLDGGERLPGLLRHRACQLLLAVEHLRESLRTGGESRWMCKVPPGDVLREVGASIAALPAALETLRRLVESEDQRFQPAAASLLHATGTGWRPAKCRKLNLTHADLHDARWPGVDLSGTPMGHADLTDADLTCARLEHAEARHTCFRRAQLAGAWLTGCDAASCDFTGADLSQIDAASCDFTGADLSQIDAKRVQFNGADLTEANLTGAKLAQANLRDSKLVLARLHCADLHGAQLEGAQIEGAEFIGANCKGARLVRLVLHDADFTDACFLGARLDEANLEYMELPNADFRNAVLDRAWLTGSVMPRATFRGARLRGAGLADVEWEGADLRDADLRESSFYLGSTRSGLVGSPIASEGSRTGFYTDDYDEQPFKSAEEIRKANLRGADLRGAKVDGVDFYLVDLRGARYSQEQGEHFRRCGAILVDRA